MIIVDVVPDVETSKIIDQIAKDCFGIEDNDAAVVKFIPKEVPFEAI
jgi:hypothetical protein